ncbi:MAG: hypothetical protein MJD61_08465 [Proteobacteria bacterium]|nr:hypothetical protein [Pseudomonadota bacterium]
MMLVMMVLLVTTAAATMAVTSTNSEMRASGHSRQALQTKYLAEAALIATVHLVDEVGPRALLHAMSLSDPPDMSVFNEPDFTDQTIDTASGTYKKESYRLYMSDYDSSLVGSGVPPVENKTCASGEIGSLGPCQAYTPWFAIDINDQYTFSGVVAGRRVDGHGSLQYMRATYTARGRTLVAGDTGDSGDSDYDSSSGRRGYHEGASDARAYAVSGPFAK